jgi:dephospho-CoA kinase
MIRIALVGSIGSGKTFISNLFGYPVFNADDSVSKIYSNNKKIFYKLKKRLPKFFTDPPIKKEELIKAIVKNKNSLNIISKIVHPEVRKDLQKFIKKHNKKKVIILDIPLLLENKLNKKKDIIIFVKSSNTEVLKRLKKRKNFNNLVFQTIKKNSITPGYKKKTFSLCN